MGADRGRLRPLDVDYTPQRRHQVAFVRWYTRATSALRVLGGVLDVVFLARQRSGGQARVVLTERAQNVMFSGRTGRSQAGGGGSQVGLFRHSHQACAATDAVPR